METDIKAMLKAKLEEIFQNEIYRSGTTYRDIRNEFRALTEKIEYGVTERELDQQERVMYTIFMLLLNGRVITLRQYSKLCNLVGEIREQKGVWA